jgi:L-rhamnose mutarotase
MSEKRTHTEVSSLVLGLALLAGCASRTVQRHGAVIAIPQESLAEYKQLHAATWPGVLQRIDQTNIHNYSIYLGQVAPDRDYLFAYYEYTGQDFDADMARMKKDRTTQEWWERTDPLQRPLPTRKEGEWWAQWQEVFHHGGPAYKQSQIKSRHGSIIGLPEKNILAYTQMHAAVWPGVLAALDKVNIRNYSIYLGQTQAGEYLLFSYFEYVGDDFQRDMAAMADDVTKLWWTYTDPLQTRLPGTPAGQQWKTMEEVFHTN